MTAGPPRSPCLRGQHKALVLLVKEGQRLVYQPLLQKAPRPAVALRGRVLNTVPVSHHLLHHRVVLLVIHLAREEDLLGRGAVEDVGDAGNIARHLPHLAQHLLGARAVVALIQVEDY